MAFILIGEFRLKQKLFGGTTVAKIWNIILLLNYVRLNQKCWHVQQQMADEILLVN